MNPLPVFPEELKELETLIRSTIKPYIHLTLLPTTEPLSVFTSKVGGDPFWVADEPYPTDSMGYPMPLLAQINFEEMPTLADFPTEGILQFYITVCDYLLGMNESYGKKYTLEQILLQKDFRVKYWAKDLFHAERLEDFSFIMTELEKVSQVDSALPYSPLEPISAQFKLTGKKDEMFINYCHGDFEALIKPFESYIKKNYQGYGDEFYSYFYEDNGQHRIGGYPKFSQDDPRTDTKGLKDFSTLLFQLDSEFVGQELGNYIICWGDVGVGNFFIHPDNLKNRNFDRVFYTWDCG